MATRARRNNMRVAQGLLPCMAAKNSSSADSKLAVDCCRDADSHGCQWSRWLSSAPFNPQTVCWPHLCCKVHDGVNFLCLQDKAEQVHGLDVSLDQLQSTRKWNERVTTTVQFSTAATAGRQTGLHMTPCQAHAEALLGVLSVTLLASCSVF